MAVRALVTGGAGFIGSNLVERLLELGHDVVVLDDLSTGSRENLSGVIEDIELIVGDIRDAELCGRTCRGASWVFHQAALGSVPRSVEDPLATYAVNATGTLNMLLAAREAEVERFVFAASSSVYGESPVLPKVETMRLNTLSPYAASKAAAECLCQSFAHAYGLPSVALRYFNVFGPRQSPDGPYAAVVPSFFEHLSHGQRATIYGDGEQTRDFTFIENVVHANVLATQAQASAFGQVMNIASEEQVSINTLYREIANLCGVDLKPDYTRERAGDVKHSLADISLAVRLLGYQPKVHYREGLRLTWEAMVASES